MYSGISSENTRIEINLFSGTSYCSSKDALNLCFFWSVWVQTQPGPPATSVFFMILARNFSLINYYSLRQGIRPTMELHKLSAFATVEENKFI